jgi:hypothetical protein
MSSNAIILLRAINGPNDYSFSYPLEAKLREFVSDRMISLDSLSDRTILSYLNEMVAENEQTIIVVDLRTPAKLGIISPILNSFIKKGKIKLFCLGESKGIAPFMKLYQGIEFDSERELVSYFNSKLSASS